MSIELPPIQQRNLLVIDYLIDHCSLEAVVKYFESQDASITALVQRDTRFCSLLAKYLRSMHQRKNVCFYFTSTKPRLKTESMKIVEQVLLRNSCSMECDEPSKHEHFEMYSTMQFLNVKQSFYDTTFDILLHISIPASAKNDCLENALVSFQPQSTFLINTVDVTMSIEKISKNQTSFTVHEMPCIQWTHFAHEKKSKEEITMHIDTLACGQKATNQCRKQFVANDHQMPVILQCKEWQGNYLIAILLQCRREFAR